MKQYILGSDISGKFAVKEDDIATTPLSATCVVYNAKSKEVTDGNTEIKPNIVLYRVPGQRIKKPGVYTLVFNIRVKDFGLTKHSIAVEVKPVPIAKGAK